jgi:hypothetical protein
LEKLSNVNPFCIFDIPFQQNFNSKYTIDLIVGLYSIYTEILIIQLYISDIFVGKYILIPYTMTPLDRFLLRFLFYGSESNNLIQIKYAMV